MGTSPIIQENKTLKVTKLTQNKLDVSYLLSHLQTSQLNKQNSQLLKTCLHTYA